MKFNWERMQFTPHGDRERAEAARPFDERVLGYRMYTDNNPASDKFVAALGGFARAKGLNIYDLDEDDFRRFVLEHSKLADEVCNTDDPACIAAYAETLH